LIYPLVLPLLLIGDSLQEGSAGVKWEQQLFFCCQLSAASYQWSHC